MTDRHQPNPRRLLLVEDEALVAEEIQDRLVRKGYGVVGITDTGAKAIELARSTETDLILMDIRLKGEMDGIEAARRIYEQLGIPTIFLTAHSDPATVARALGPAQFGYLVKPIREQDLLVAIETALHRHGIENRLAESQLSHVAIFEAAADAIAGLDLGGRIRSWNPAAERLFGYSHQEVLGRSNQLLAAPGYEGQSAELMERVWAGGRIDLYDIVRRAKDGSLVDIALSISPVRDRRGSIIGAVEISRDVTERRKLEEDLRQAQKMQALGLLAGGVAHDFNNLLTVINGYAAMVSKMLSDQPEAQRQIDQIYQAGKSAAGITEKLLAFSQKRIAEPEVLDLNGVINRFRAIVEQLCGAGINLEFDLYSGLGPILATEASVHTVLLNLVANARDAMPDGGGLIVRTSASGASTSADDHEHLRPYSVLTVQDSGHGIAPEMMGKVFDPFFTTKQPGRGAGLGLATVYGIVKQRGGWIHMDSHVGKGSTFEVYWPAAGQSGTEREPERTGEIPRALSGTCLLVEDQSAVRDLCARYLRSQGWTVLKACDGSRALEASRCHPYAIDLLLSDIVMPRMSGIELAARLRLERPDMAVLLMTGYAPELSKVEVGTMLLAKPFSEEELVAAAAAALDRKRSSKSWRAAPTADRHGLRN